MEYFFSPPLQYLDYIFTIFLVCRDYVCPARVREGVPIQIIHQQLTRSLLVRKKLVISEMEPQF